MSARSTVYTISPSFDSTLAVQITRSGLRKEKHVFVFERFAGKLVYDCDDPLATSLNLSVQVDSLECRDSASNARKRDHLTEFARRQALGAESHPELQFRTTRFQPKPLRGYVLEGVLLFRGLERNIKANTGFGTEKNGRLQVDADAMLRLSDFGISCPKSLFGLAAILDEVELHALLWGTTDRPKQTI